MNVQVKGNQITKRKGSCKLCNKEFLMVRKNHIYCSNKCYNRNLYYPTITVVKNKVGKISHDCKNCNMEFIGFKWQKYCSVECRKLARRKRYLENVLKTRGTLQRPERSVEHKRKLSESWSYEKHFNAEIKKKISIGISSNLPRTSFKKGHIPWNKGFTKGNNKSLKSISNHMKKRIISKETRKKMSETNKKLYREKLKVHGMLGKKHSADARVKMSEGIFRNGGNIKSSERMKTKNPMFEEFNRKKMSASIQGKSLDNWKKFISREPYSQNWNNKFKRAIRRRDNQICMLCLIHQEKLKRALCVHHINYDKQLTVSENCVSLCLVCHSRTHTNRIHWKTFFQSLLSEKYGYKYQDGDVLLEVEDGSQN